MRIFIKSFLLLSLFFMASCEGLVDDINENPNELTLEDVDPDLLLTGAMLANTVAQGGHLNRIAGMYSGQLIGYIQLYANIYGYSLSSEESVSTWSRIYIGAVPNLRYIREQAPNDKLLTGICKILEAHAVGTAASLFGDVPYSEINNDEIADPKFDSQRSVFEAMIALLDSGIADLAGDVGRPLAKDIYYKGNADKWVEAANTLKARYLLQMKDYSKAYAAAQSGISTDANSMRHIPQGDASINEGDKNLFWEILEGSRAGYIGNKGSFFLDLLGASGAAGSRNNAKTDENARLHYLTIDETGGSPNKGVIEQFETQRLVSYAENQLILAECAARTAGFGTALGHLNDFRAWLNTGGFLNDNFADSTYLYDAYEEADFENGGMENANGLDKTRALLREIIEERYVSGFQQYMPFNDARRLRKSDSDISVPIPLNTTAATQHVERFPYSDDELNANSNGPAEDPGIFVKTEVNQ